MDACPSVQGTAEATVVRQKPCWARLFRRERLRESGTGNESRDWFGLGTFRAIVIDRGNDVKIVCARFHFALRSPYKEHFSPGDSVKRFAHNPGPSFVGSGHCHHHSGRLGPHPWPFLGVVGGESFSPGWVNIGAVQDHRWHGACILHRYQWSETRGNR